MKRDVDWRHYAGAAVLLIAFGFLLYFWWGRGPNLLTAPAPPGSHPVHDTPPETPR